jgi:hypothetical protein
MLLEVRSCRCFCKDIHSVWIRSQRQSISTPFASYAQTFRGDSQKAKSVNWQVVCYNLNCPTNFDIHQGLRHGSSHHIPTAVDSRHASTGPHESELVGLPLMFKLDSTYNGGVPVSVFREAFALCQCGLVTTRRVFKHHQCATSVTGPVQRLEVI